VEVVQHDSSVVEVLDLGMVLLLAESTMVEKIMFPQSGIL